MDDLKLPRVYEGQSFDDQMQAKREAKTHLDKSRDKRDNVVHLAHINIKMSKLILDSLLKNNLTALPHSRQTPQVSRRVKLRIRRAGQISLVHLERRVGGQRCDRIVV